MMLKYCSLLIIHKRWCKASPCTIVCVLPSCMADYWKSQAKKFCDFCKCWIADNKPSVGFHESGKRHKENVTKRLAEITKKSTKSHQESLQVDLEMKKMEEEAMKAYLKDLQENPDYTSKMLLEQAERKKQELEESVKKQKEADKEREEPMPEQKPETVTETSSKVWYEAKSDEGYTYYWNVNTSESIWEPPEEGFVSIVEQEKEAKLKEEMKRRKKEEKAKRKQEEMNISKDNVKKKKKKEESRTKEDSSVIVGPAPKPEPYGAWTVVEPKVEEPLDLELPHQEFVAIKVPELREPEVKFKEKTIESLDKDPLLAPTVKQEATGSTESFKKRKFNRGNMRQKLDTE